MSHARDCPWLHPTYGDCTCGVHEPMTAKKTTDGLNEKALEAAKSAAWGEFCDDPAASYYNTCRAVDAAISAYLKAMNAQGYAFVEITYGPQ